MNNAVNFMGVPAMYGMLSQPGHEQSPSAQASEFLRMAIQSKQEQLHTAAIAAARGEVPIKEEPEEDFWKQRAKRQEEFMRLQQEAAARRRLMMKLRINGGSVSAAELLMGLL